MAVDKGLGFTISLGSGPPKPREKDPDRAAVFARALMRSIKNGDEESVAGLLRSSGLLRDDDDDDDEVD